MAMTSPVRDRRRPAKPVANTAWPRLGRKGAFGAALAVASVAMLGMAALAAEGGKWYLVRRNAQSAADTAALAGAVTLGWQGITTAGQNLAIAASHQVATRNGFPNTSPTVVTPTPCQWNGSNCPANSTAPNAMQVIIRDPQTTILSRLVTSLQPEVVVSAVAMLRAIGNACTLSLHQPTTVTGNNDLDVRDCVVASNYSQSGSIDCGGQANTVNLVNSAFYSVGGTRRCNDVPASQIWSGLPVEDPYRSLQTVNWPRPANQGQACQSKNDMQPGKNSSAWTVQPYQMNGRFICGNIQVTNGQTLNFPPGIYFFYDSSFKVTGGTVTGNGVTLVFLAPRNNQGTVNGSPGTLSLTGGTIRLTAPPAGTTYGYSQLEGMLMYREYYSGNDNRPFDSEDARYNNPNTMFLGGNTDALVLGGGIYAPTSQIQVVGVSSTNNPLDGCTSIVAGEITFSGNSDVRVDGCGAYGTDVATVRIVRLVQ